jgi:lipoprotein-anchoring transpeptidase ErfK/SrfK
LTERQPTGTVTVQESRFDQVAFMQNFSRRAFTFGSPLVLAGCAAGGLSLGGNDPSAIYAPVPGERFAVPRINLSEIDPQFYRREVSYSSSEAPGTIIVDPANHFLYQVKGAGRANRYGVGVGKQGFGWSGTARIARKSEWPNWFPPAEMQIRDKRAAKYAGGMPGGIENPLGARAMYLYQGDQDTLYRIHGTIEPASIGKSMSSGCIRLLNQDVIDLYRNTPVGTKVIVMRA